MERRRPLTLAALRRSALYRPIAATMALLMAAIYSPRWLEDIARHVAPMVTSAQISGCLPGGNTIIQNYCVGGVVFVDDLKQLEKDAVDAYLAFHNLPATDASVIYDLGRTDLRNAIRANMVTILLAIIAKPETARTAHEANLYRWLEFLVWENEIALYTHAIAQFNAWRNDPCRFTLDPVVASTYGLSYSGAPFCSAPLTSLFGGPQVPAESYFTAYGLKKSYGATADRFENFGSLVAGTQINVGVVVGTAAAVGAVFTVIAGSVLAASLAAAVTAEALALSSALYVLSFSTVEAAGMGALVAGPVAIILIAIAIGISAGMQTFQNQETLDNLNKLTDTLTKVTNTPPDLAAFAVDTNGVGMYKLQSTVVSQTVPNVPSTAALPTHRAGTDWNFIVGNSVTDTLTYQDWDGKAWSAQTWGGWFVQACTSSEGCHQADSIHSNIHYLDWNGVKWTASRHGDLLVSIKGTASATDIDCPANAVTRVTPGDDFSQCRNYVSTTIPLKDGTGTNVRVGLSSLDAPLFTGPASLPFTPGVASEQRVVAEGKPTPTICVVASDLPAQISLNGGSCAAGTFVLSFSGSSETAKGQYTLKLEASNGIGPAVAKTLKIDVDDHLAITSPNTLEATAGFPVNFLITTTGTPTPTLTLDPQIALNGLTFRDNGNGTATISGVATHGFITFCQEGACFGINATNSRETVKQVFGITMASPPPAELVAPNARRFTAGVPNSVTLNSTGAVTRVTWLPVEVSEAPWLRLTDNWDGSATLSGTPPAGTSETYFFTVSPTAAGTLTLFTNFSLEVVPGPVFTSPNSATFTVGTAGEFPISASVGTIDIVGKLPKGLTFSGGSTASISGTPAAGTGGQYQITLTDDAGDLGKTTQSLLLNVFEAPKITSSSSATLVVGAPSSFAVTTFGFPSVSWLPLTDAPTPPTDPSAGQGMYFTVTGLPASLRASHLNPEGFATGTLTIQGTPSATDAGTRQIRITAENGVGVRTEQLLTLNIVSITAPAPTTSTTCNGIYNGTLKGALTVSAGQSCVIVGGRVEGSVTANGGTLVLDNTSVTSNVWIQGATAFSIGSGATIGGNLTIRGISGGGSTNRVCGATVTGNLAVSTNAAAVQIGSSDVVSCPGNTVGGNASVQDNAAATAIFNNVVTKNLSCSGNASITGGGNTAQKSSGQCARF